MFVLSVLVVSSHHHREQILNGCFRVFSEHYSARPGPPPPAGERCQTIRMYGFLLRSLYRHEGVCLGLDD